MLADFGVPRTLRALHALLWLALALVPVVVPTVALRSTLVVVSGVFATFALLVGILVAWVYVAPGPERRAAPKRSLTRVSTIELTQDRWKWTLVNISMRYVRPIFDWYLLVSFSFDLVIPHHPYFREGVGSFFVMRRLFDAPYGAAFAVGFSIVASVPLFLLAQTMWRGIVRKTGFWPDEGHVAFAAETICNTAFLAILSGILPGVWCVDGEVAGGAVACWQGTHLAVGTASLIALVTYVPFGYVVSLQIAQSELEAMSAVQYASAVVYNPLYSILERSVKLVLVFSATHPRMAGDALGLTSVTVVTTLAMVVFTTFVEPTNDGPSNAYSQVGALSAAAFGVGSLVAAVVGNEESWSGIVVTCALHLCLAAVVYRRRRSHSVRVGDRGAGVDARNVYGLAN